jgi:cystinosin
LYDDWKLKHNVDNWGGITGDPVKFGLGLLSIGFDVIFMVQHYILYTDRGASYKQVKEEDVAINAPPNQ